MVFVWPGLVVMEVISSDPVYPRILPFGAFLSPVAAFPFVVLGLTGAGRSRGALRAAVIGGLAASALVWLPSNVWLVREVIHPWIGWGWMLLLPFWLVSPLVVWLGMGVGRYVGHLRGRAG